MVARALRARVHARAPPLMRTLSAFRVPPCPLAPFPPEPSVNLVRQEKAGGVPIDENFLEDDWDLDMVED